MTILPHISVLEWSLLQEIHKYNTTKHKMVNKFERVQIKILSNFENVPAS